MDDEIKDVVVMKEVTGDEVAEHVDLISVTHHSTVCVYFLMTSARSCFYVGHDVVLLSYNVAVMHEISICKFYY